MLLTKRQTNLMRRLYTANVELDEVSRGYVGVILTCLDTIDALRRGPDEDGPEVSVIKFFTVFPNGAVVAGRPNEAPIEVWKGSCASRKL